MAPTDWPVVVARFALVTLGVGLFGWSCFPLYAPFAGRERAPAPLRVLAPFAAAVAGLVWIGALGREATGTEGLPDPGALVQLCAATSFGRALAAAVILSLALAAVALAPRPAPPRLPAVLAGGLLVSLAFVGHAAAAEGGAGAVRIAIMAAHLLFAGVWLGGLAPLAMALRQPAAEIERLLRAFGKVGMGAVAALVTTGMIDAAAILGLAGRPPGRTYLITFGIKLTLVAALLAVASVNRWSVTPLAARNPAAARRSLWATLALEQLLALSLLAAVARLAQLDPGM